jgi:hypothetical protein
MPKPTEEKKHLGTFGANGEYIFQAFSDGTDPNPRGFSVIPKDRSFQKLQGSNKIYAWRANHSHLPQLQALFVPCYCSRCRGEISGECMYRKITHSLIPGLLPELFTTHEVPNASKEGDSD